jgi:hypothetical protein
MTNRTPTTHVTPVPLDGGSTPGCSGDDGARLDRAPGSPPCEPPIADRAPGRLAHARHRADQAPERLARARHRADQAPGGAFLVRLVAGEAPERSDLAQVEAAEQEPRAEAGGREPGEAECDEGIDAEFQALRAEREALAPSEVASVNLDVNRAAGLVLNVIPGIEALRPELARLPGLDMAAIDGLRERALALIYANAILGPRKPRSKGLFAAARKLRARLRVQVAHLANEWGYLDPAIVERVSGKNTGLALARDLITLTGALRSRWSDVEPRTPLEEADLDDAEQLAMDLMRETGARRLRRRAERHDDRARAFTLLVRAYEEARHGVRYVRRHNGDADAIAPSLYASPCRRDRRR